MAGRFTQIVIVLIYLGISLLVTACVHNSSTDKDIYHYRDGDIILRKGRGFISDIIAASIKDSLPYSHCGILVKEKQQWKVIHSVARELSNADGVQQCSLYDFIAESDDSCFMIVRCRIDNAGFLIASAAKDYLKRKIPFDYQFNMADSSAFFCTELPLHILKNRFNITFESKDKYIPFSVFTDSVYFNVVQKVH